MLFPVLMIYPLLDSGPLTGTRTDPKPAVELSDHARLEVLCRLAKQHSSAKSYPLAKQYITEAFDLAAKKNLRIPYNLYWADAEVMFSMKDYSHAWKQMEMACKLLKETSQYQQTAEASTFFARIMLYTGDFANAIELFRGTILLAQEKKLNNIIPECYRGLADTYNVLNKRDEEKNAIQMLVKTSREENDQENLARGYYRLGEYTHAVDSNFANSNSYYMEALKIRANKGDTSLFPAILNRISWNYYLLKQLDTALKYYNRTLDISMKQNQYPFIANAYGNIGTIYRDKQEYEKALYNYGKSATYAMLSKDWFNLSWINKDMSDLYIMTGDYKKAYECYVAYKAYDDSLNQKKYSVSLTDARMRYETDAKAKDLELVTLKLDKQRYFIFALAGILLLILVTGLLLFRQSKMSARRRISEMNRKISEITQANLRQQMNPHFIFNTLNSIQYYMYQHDKITTNNYLTKFSSLMRKTLENSQFTVIPIKDELDALQLYLELESLRFKEKFEYHISMDEEIDPLIFKIPAMLLQPYVENSICHGLINKEGKGMLNINIESIDTCLLFTIEDNGIGREAALKIKQGKEKNHPPLGTKITESRIELANALHGTQMKVQYTDLKDEQGRAAGTRVEIQTPIIT